MEIKDYRMGKKIHDPHSLRNDKIFSDQIINSSRSMISIINRNYTYEKVNRSFCAAHKGKSRDFIGKTLAEVWGRETFHDKIRKNIDLCLTGRTIRYKADFGTPLSGTRYFEVVFRPVKTVKGTATHVMAETYDISEVKKSEIRLKEISKEIKIQENNFRKHIMASRKFAAIGTLAGGIAHDFNNILAAIAGYAEMLKDDLAGDQVSAEKAVKILRAVNRAKSLTDQILNFSRHSEGKLTPVNVNEILLESVGFLMSLAPEGITCETNIPDSVMTVISDPGDLFRMSLNLLTNAVQAMEKYGGRITVSASLIKGNDVKHLPGNRFIARDYAVLTFSDTGPGMDAGTAKHIFDPFFSGKDAAGKAGLGLSVVHKIITDMEGTISVSCQKGRGSIFTIYLPLLSNQTGENNNCRLKKILVINGNDVNHPFLNITLGSYGFEITNVRGNGKSLNMIAASDLSYGLLLYIGNGEKNETIRRNLINAGSLFPGIPCFLITDRHMRDIGGEFLNSGIVKEHFITPVLLEELKGKIELLLL